MKTLGAAYLTAIFAVGCGVTVVVPGETGGSPSSPSGTSGGSHTGQGGGGGEPSGTGGGESTGDGPSECGTSCSVPPSGETCVCTNGCGDLAGGAFEKISCAPTVDLEGKHKVECVCSVPNFSGVCFELDLPNLCNFTQGCCAQYFTGK